MRGCELLSYMLRAARLARNRVVVREIMSINIVIIKMRISYIIPGIFCSISMPGMASATFKQ